MEDYVAKMGRKSLAELRAYVAAWPDYREAAVVAALDELARRGERLTPDELALRARLAEEAAQVAVREEAENARVRAEQQAARDRYAPEPEGGLFGGPAVADREATSPAPRPGDDEVEDDEEEAEAEQPRLYSPTVILWFSVLFTFFSGGILLALNLRRVRQRTAVWLVVAFCVLYYVGVALLFGNGLSPAGLSNFLNIPAALVFNLWFWPRYIGFGRSFKPRPFLWPLLICLGLTGGMAYYVYHFHPEVLRAAGLLNK